MIKELRKLEKAGLITLRAHDELPLWIANYTPDVQYGRLWDEHELLKKCRGLIVNDRGEVIARPFPKFFNIEEHEEFDSLPDIPYNERSIVYEKLDGSLGIIFWYKGEWRVATRGSFHSDQADKARELLEKYDTEKLDKEYTYLVEIIYPENRIVVDYGDMEELILVAMIRTEDGAEPMKLERYKNDKPYNAFPIVKETPFNIHSLKKYRHILEDKKKGEDAEGYVIRFIESGLRIKVKLQDYVRLHRLMTGLTKRKVWELLKDGEDIEELYKTAPDEVYDWVEETADELRKEFVKYNALCLSKFFQINQNTYMAGYEFGTDEFRTEFADRVMKDETVKKLKISSILFSLLDNKDYFDKIWKLIYPEHEPIFTNENTT